MTATAMSSWSTGEVSKWLSENGFGDVVEKFSTLEITGADLCKFTLGDLREKAGLSFGKAKKLHTLVESAQSSSNGSEPKNRHRTRARTSSRSRRKYSAEFKKKKKPPPAPPSETVPRLNVGDDEEALKKKILLALGPKPSKKLSAKTSTVQLLKEALVPETAVDGNDQERLGLVDALKENVTLILDRILSYKKEILSIVAEDPTQDTLKRIQFIHSHVAVMYKVLEEVIQNRRRSTLILDMSRTIPSGDIRLKVADMAKSSAMAVDHVNRNLLSIKNSAENTKSLKRVHALHKIIEVLKNHLDADEVECTALSEEETMRVAATIDDETSIKLDSIPMTISLNQSIPEANFGNSALHFGTYVKEKGEFRPLLLKFDFHESAMLRWEKVGGKPKIVPFGFFDTFKFTKDGSRDLLSFSPREQPPFSVYPGPEVDQLKELLPHIIRRSYYTYIKKLSPKLCLISGSLSIKRLGGRKRHCYGKVLNGRLLVFPSESENIPLFVMKLLPGELKKSGVKTLLLDTGFTKFELTLPDTNWCDHWYGACTKAASVTDEDVSSIVGKLKAISDAYGEPYDNRLPEHKELLKQLWTLACGREEDFVRTGKAWKSIGFQAEDPLQDFRDAGVLALKNLVYMAKHYPKMFEQFLDDQKSSLDKYYPLAASGVNITAMLAEIFELGRFAQTTELLSFPSLETYPLFFFHEEAFSQLYCLTFRLFVNVWNELGVGYLEFSKAIEETKKRLLDLLHRPAVGETPAIWDLLGVLLV